MNPKKLRELPLHCIRQTGWRTALLLMSLTALHCGGDPLVDPSPAAEQLALSPSNPQIAKGTAQQFTVQSLLPSGQVRDRTPHVKWRVAREGAGGPSLPSDGLVQLEEPGRYTVTAELGNRTLATVITVTAATLKSLSLSPSAPQLAKGLSLVFTATGSFSDGTTQDVTRLSTWSVKDVVGTGVAVITTLGVATGKNVGKTRVAVRYLTRSANTTLEVTPATLNTLTVSPTNPTIAKGSAQPFSASGTFSDGSVQDITADVAWAIADVMGSGVASIAGSGVSVGLAVGQARVSATYQGQLAETTMTVTAAAVVSLAVTPCAVTLAKGTAQQLTATATFSDATQQVVSAAGTWTAADVVGTGVAAVDNTGLAKGNAEGSANIVCTYRGYTGSATVKVTPAVLARLQVQPASATVGKGLTQRFAVVGTYSDGSSQDLTLLAAWTAADVVGTDVASVSAAGLALGKNLGSATLTAAYQGKTGLGSLTVTAATLASLAIDPLSPQISTGATQQLHATGTFSDGSKLDLTNVVSWTATDLPPASGVATVSASGLATGKVEGQATVLAQYRGLTATTTLTVSDGPCAPGSYRCGPANAVEICNSTGTAWLFSQSCALSCSAGLCTGSCTPAERRCNVKSVQECSPDGTMWTAVGLCTGSCISGQCALDSLDVTTSRNLDGEIFVDGDFIVRAGVTVTASSGQLTVHARNVVVENLGTLISAAKGNKFGNGTGNVPGSSDGSGSGGGNGTAGASGYHSVGGSAINSNTDSEVQGGGSGAAGYSGYGGAGGLGGGVIRLIAQDKIAIAGKVTADGTAGTGYISTFGGGGGGGAGGGILLAAVNDVAVAGTVSAAGGGGGSGYSGVTNKGGDGGLGRVRFLAGASRKITGTAIGKQTSGLLPPLVITSSSHPDPNLIYNDNFDLVQLAWGSPFLSRQGYYQLLNPINYTVPTPVIGRFITAEKVSYPGSAVQDGANYFHIVPIDAVSNLGTVENNFRIQINTKAPTLRSDSHPAEGTWYPNLDVVFSWSFPVADANEKGIRYVVDTYGDTVPTPADSLIPVPQKRLLKAGFSPGIWVLHAVAVDQRDYLTRAAAHFRVQLGPDPGTGVVYGRVTDSTGTAVDGATLSLNRGLWSLASDSSGNYSLPRVAAGTYELRATKPGHLPVTQTITVTKAAATLANVKIL